MTHAIGIERAREAVSKELGSHFGRTEAVATAAIAAYLSALKPSGDAGEFCDRLEQYAKDWRDRAASPAVVLDAIATITAFVAENERQGQQIQRMEYSDGDAEHWRFLAAGLELQLATAREALDAAFDFLGGVDGASEIRGEILRALTPGVSDAE